MFIFQKKTIIDFPDISIDFNTNELVHTHSAMNLCNGKIKTVPIDLDDNYELMSWSLDETRYDNQMENIQTPSIDTEVVVMCKSLDESQLQTKMLNQREKFVDSVHSMEKYNGLNVPPDTMQNQANAMSIQKVANVESHKRPNRKQPVYVIDGPALNSNEKRTYVCYLCGKTFQFLCRLTAHWPSHTQTRRFKCMWCLKCYKNASSLNSHKKKGHSCKPQSTIPKNDSKKLNELKMASSHLNDMEMSMEWVPLELEKLPYIWDESDLKLTLPPITTGLIDKSPVEMPESDRKENGVACKRMSDQVEWIGNAISKVSDAGNRPTDLTATKMKPPKFVIWQKEAADPAACYVDILRAHNSKKTHRPTLSSMARPSNTTITRKNGNGGSVNSSKTMKNINLASKFRTYGDIEFSQKKWDSAWQWYNRSLCHADKRTYIFASTYAKRAQCYFRRRMYRTCWADLRLAKSVGLPMTPFVQLLQSCKSMINKQYEQNNKRSPPSPSPIEPMLSFDADKMFPEMVDALQIDWNVCDGRHIRARESIAVGQILIIETGFVATTTAYYEKCFVCLSADTNLMPCSRCTQALLCRNCVNGHRIECELQMALNLYENPWLTKVLRSFLNAVNLFETVDELMKFVADAISSRYEMQPIVPIGIDQSSKYRAFLQLIVRPTIPLALISMVSKLHTALINHPVVGLKFQSKKSRRFLAHLLVHHICVINAFTTKIGGVDSGHKSLEIIAPITSYLTHACAPNVSKFLLGNSIIVVAMRPIESGEQLFVSYCDVLEAKHDRQATLQTEYGFQCSCERCLSNSDSIPSSDGKPTADQQFQAFHCNTIDEFVRQNYGCLTGHDQIQRKQLSEHVIDILQRYGRMPWNYTIGSAYVILSLLLSQRFQKKLQY